MKRVITVLLALVCTFSFASCKTSSDIYAEKVYNARVNSTEKEEKIGELLTEMNFYIKTAFCNYTVDTEKDNTLILTFRESLPEDSGFEQSLNVNTALLFALIKDLNRIQYQYTKKGEKVTESIDRNAAETVLGAKPTDLYSNYDAFLETLIKFKITDKDGRELEKSKEYTVNSGLSEKK